MPERLASSVNVAAGPAGAARPDGARAAASTDRAAVVLGLLAIGETTIEGVAEDPDIARLARACAALGARVERTKGASLRIAGVGIGGLVAPAAPLDLGADVEAAGLVAALVGSHPVAARLLVASPPASLAPLIAALGRMGALIDLCDADGSTVLQARGPRETVPIALEAEHAAPAPSALAAAVLLAGLNSPGHVSVRVRAGALAPVVDLLRRFGAQFDVTTRGETDAVVLHGQPELRGARIAASRGASANSQHERSGPDADTLATREPPAWAS